MENKIELGSEFHIALNDLSLVDNNLFTYFNAYETRWLNYGRTAIMQIPIPSKGTILLPEFICESVISCFPKERIQFYHINDKFEIVIDDLLDKVNGGVTVIYIAHYFGFCQNYEDLCTIRTISEQYGITIIEDTTQSLFSQFNLVGDYCVASIRKWMQTPQGGVLYTMKGKLTEKYDLLPCSKDNEKAYGQILKSLFLRDNLNVNREYREIFTDAEMRIDTLTPLERMSDFSRFIISCIDVDTVISKRKRNAHYVNAALEDMGLESIKPFSESMCPLVYPIRVNNRDEFRQYLMENRIYCAVHWPFDGMMPGERYQGIRNAQTLISLPIDQRYGMEEMEYMMEIIRHYRGELLF